MSTKIVYGKYLVIDADTLISSGALYIENDTIVDYGTYEEITGKYRADKTLGSAETLIIPGLVNAHSHGKGLTDFQRGQVDDTLETWKWRSFPPVDPYLDTLFHRGIAGLFEAVTSEYGYEPADGYLSKCHLCFDLRRFLVLSQGVESKDLAPRQFYAEV